MAAVLTDLSEPVMFTNPWPRYAELRRNAPLSRAKSQFSRSSFMLTRYADVMMLHSDRRFSSDPMANGSVLPLQKFMPRMFRLLTDSMVFKDDPDHQRLRGLVNKVFTPKMVQNMSPTIERIVATLTDRLAANGTVDLVRDLAVPLPLAVISEMLGVPDEDRDEFHALTETFSNATSSGPAQLIKALPAARRMMKLLERLVDYRRTNPDDRIITGLVRAEEDGESLNADEVVAMVFLLLLAGHDTTANLIGNSIVALLDNPDQLERLRAHPEMIASAVEEFLRYTTPVPCGAIRTTLGDVEVSGGVIPKGSKVLGMIISANRDETVFDDPDTLDIGRDPNRHLAFAYGSHFCIGSHLARLEGRIAINAFLQRFAKIELAVPRDELTYKPTQSLRGLRRLPLRVA